jgi:hypothetical protein
MLPTQLETEKNAYGECYAFWSHHLETAQRPNEDIRLEPESAWSRKFKFEETFKVDHVHNVVHINTETASHTVTSAMVCEGVSRKGSSEFAHLATSEV